MSKAKFCHLTVSKKLEEKGATNPCHRCNATSFAVIDEMSHFGLQEFIAAPTLGGSSIPVALIVCKNCGAITPHALGALDLIPEEEQETSE
ncbi:TPA: hypothetical protein ACPJ2O_003754 [Vibrio diabolicus]